MASAVVSSDPSYYTDALLKMGIIARLPVIGPRSIQVMYHQKSYKDGKTIKRGKPWLSSPEFPDTYGKIDIAGTTTAFDEVNGFPVGTTKQSDIENYVYYNLTTGTQLTARVTGFRQHGDTRGNYVVDTKPAVQLAIVGLPVDLYQVRDTEMHEQSTPLESA